MADPVTTEGKTEEVVKVETAPKVETPAKGSLLDQTPEPKAGEVDKTKPPEAKGEEKKVDDKGKPADAKTDEVVSVKLPEGFKADPAALAEFSKLAQETGLKSDGAQKLFDFYVKAQQAQAKEVAEQTAKWEAEIKAKPGYEAELGLAKKAIVKLADSETQTLLTGTWMGSHPGVLKFLASVGRLIKEDGFVEGGSARKETTAADMFPSMKPKQ